MDCEERCLNDLNCAGFSFKIPFYSTYGEKECWTYSAILAEGDGARNKRCYMKKCKNNSFVFCNTLAALIRLANIWISHTFFLLVTWQQTEFLGKLWDLSLFLRTSSARNFVFLQVTSLKHQ